MISARRWSLIGLGLLVTIAAGYYAVRDVEFDDLWNALRTSEFVWLLPATGVLAIGVFLRAVRWQALFRPESRPPLPALSRALLIGYFFNTLLPFRAGEAARVVALRQMSDTPRVESAATVVTERVYDLVALLGLLFIALAWLPDVTWIHAAVLLAAVLAVALGVVVLVLARWRNQTVALGSKLAGFLPFVSDDQARHAVQNLSAGLTGLASRRMALIGLAWTVLSWLVMALSFWLVTLCFDLGLPPVAGLLVLVATSLSLIVPSSPAALGVFEAAVVVALRAYEVPTAEALSYGLLLHAVNSVPFLLAGAAVLTPRAPFFRSRRAHSAT